MPVLHLPSRDRRDNRRHHSQVRISPWATFFNGVEPTNKLTATALTTGEISTGRFYRAQAGRGPGRFFRMSRSAFELRHLLASRSSQTAPASSVRGRERHAADRSPPP